MFRSGIQSIDSGQYEASRALGIGPLQRLRVIIIPQALSNIFLALGNYALVLVKDSSLVAVISVSEFMRSGEILAAAHFQALLVITIVGDLYFLMRCVLTFAFLFGQQSFLIHGFLVDSFE